MPSSYTLNNGIELIGTGEQSGTWGDTTNTNLELLDAALDGQVTITAASAGSSGSPNSLPISDGSASNGRNRLVNITSGTNLGSTVYYQLTPNDAEKIIYIRNSLNTQDLIVFQGTYNSSNDYVIPNGTTAVIFFNGAGSGAVAANVFNNAHFDNLNIVGDVTIGDDLTLNSDGAIINIGADNDLQITHSGSAGTITNATGNLTLDVAGDITLNADGGDWLFYDGSVTLGSIQNDGSDNIIFMSNTNDKDIKFLGIDNSSTVTALLLDMSEAGAATFNSSVIIPQKLIHSGDTDTYLEFTTNQIDLIVGNVATFKSSASEVIINEASADIDFRVESDNQTHMLFVDAGNGRIGINESAPDATFHLSNSQANSASQGMILEGTWPWLKFLDTENNQNTFAIYNDSALYFTRLAYADRNNAPNGGVDSLILYETQTVFNEDSADLDFRVESDGSTHMLFLDAGNNRIGINQSSPTSLLDVAQENNTNSIISARFNATNRKVGFQANNSNGQAYIGSNINSVSGSANSTYDIANRAAKIDFANGIEFYTAGSGSAGATVSFTNNLEIDTTGSVFNEAGVDLDFRVESDATSHMLFVNAGTDTVQIRSSTNPSFGTFPLPSLYAKGTTDGKYGIVHFEGQADNSVLGLGHDATGNYFVFNASYRDNGAFSSLQFHDPSNQSALTIGMESSTAESVFNDNGANKDFRVESGSNTHMLFVDADGEYVSVNTNGSVGFGGKFNVNGNKGTGSGIPSQQITVADFTALRTGGGGAIQFNGVYDTSNNLTAAGSVEAYKRNDTSGNYGFGLQFKSRTHGGTNDERLYMDEANTVFNDISANTDFRVESDSNANMFLVDASADTIGIGTTQMNVVGNNAAGINLLADGMLGVSRAGVPLKVNRTGDGDIVEFYSAAGKEGTISISGSTTSYNGFSGLHESSGILTNTPVGTVVSTIDELDTYVSGPKTGQVRIDHAKVKVSDTAGDACVYGVVGSFNAQDKVNVVSVGIGSVRVTGACAKGDLLESNGDGTAKVQSDDIVRSKTLGKVTIGNSNTGVKLVSCVMYCG